MGKGGITLTSSARALVLVDGENNPDLDPPHLLSQLDGRYEVTDTLVFADFRKDWVRRLARRCAKADVTMIHVESQNGNGSSKGAVDKTMYLTMWKHVNNGASPSVFVIVSGDKVFAHHVRVLRDLGKRVIVAANPNRVSRILKDAANEFIPLQWNSR